MNGGVFYTDQATEIIVDTSLTAPIPSQNLLLDSLRRCNDLVQRDMRYAHLVAGASKMPMDMIWTSRNQDELVNDTDLAKLKDLAWNEFIQKRYLPAITGGDSLASTAASLLDIVREMNLQRRRFQIMGLHEQVEASEIQLVLHLCQAQILRPPSSPSEYRSLANRFRRHDRFYEAFALAVGAFVCSSAPFTLGAATTRYERDLQYEYKKHTTALFVYVLQQHPGALGEAGAYDEDYVLRISRLIVVWPDGGGGGGGGGGGLLQSFPGPPPPPDEPCDKDLLLNAVAAAQAQSDKAERMAGRAERETRRLVDEGRRDVGARFEEAKLQAESATREVRDRLNAMERVADQHRAEEKLRNAEQLLSLKTTIFTMLGVRTDSSGGERNRSLFDEVKEVLQSETRGDISRLEEKITTQKTAIEHSLKDALDNAVSAMDTKLAEFKKKCAAECQALKDQLAAMNTALGEQAKFRTTVENEITEMKSANSYLIGQLNAAFGSTQHVSAQIQQPDSTAAIGGYVQNMSTSIASWVAGVSAQQQATQTHLADLKNRVAATEVATGGLPELGNRIAAVEASIQTSAAAAVNTTETLRRQEAAIAKNKTNMAEMHQSLTSTSTETRQNKSNLADLATRFNEINDKVIDNEWTSEANFDFIRTFMGWGTAGKREGFFSRDDDESEDLDDRVMHQIQEHFNMNRNAIAEEVRNAVFEDPAIPPGWRRSVQQLIDNTLREGGSRPNSAGRKRLAEADARPDYSPRQRTSDSESAPSSPQAAQAIPGPTQQPPQQVTRTQIEAIERRVRRLERFMNEEIGDDIYDRPQSPSPRPDARYEPP